MAWITISNNVTTWTGVRFIQGVYSNATSSVYIWGGSDILFTKHPQRLIVPSYDPASVISNLGAQRDSYSVGLVGTSLVFYGGNDAVYFNTVYDYEV